MTTTDNDSAQRLDPIYQNLVGDGLAYPPVRLDLLLDLVDWAERDDEDLAKFMNWGHWEQGSWSTFRAKQADLDVPIPYGWSDPLIQDFYGRPDAEVSEQDAVIRQELLRGICGTSFCMAGQVALQAGYRMIYAGRTNVSTIAMASADNCIFTEETDAKDAKGFPVLRDVGQVSSIGIVGQRVLGLDAVEANALFDGDNSIETIKRVVNYICENRGLPRAYPTFGSWDRSQDSDPDYDDSEFDDSEF